MAPKCFEMFLSSRRGIPFSLSTPPQAAIELQRRRCVNHLAKKSRMRGACANDGRVNMNRLVRRTKQQQTHRHMRVVTNALPRCCLQYPFF
jgi:hypothetical protein